MKKTLFDYMYHMAQIPAMSYQSWEAAFIKDEMFTRIAQLKEQFAKEDIDYTNLTYDELKTLGFRPWNESMDMLIPMWLFMLLPDETKLYCPLDEESSRDLVLRKDADDDSRCGCSAYALLETRPK